MGEQGDAGTSRGNLEESLHGLHSQDQEPCGVGEDGPNCEIFEDSLKAWSLRNVNSQLKDLESTQFS